MSILIKGMEMPESCSRCFCMASCRLWKNIMHPEFNRHRNCPLVPIPPHGRLGDLDELVERIDGIWDCNDMVFRPNDKICKIPEDCKGCKWAQTKDCIQRMVENAPTIIPAEEGE